MCRDACACTDVCVCVCTTVLGVVFALLYVISKKSIREIISAEDYNDNHYIDSIKM